MFVQFAELPVSDQDRAKAFYLRHFDCQVVADVPMAPDGWRWIELKLPDAETALHFLRRHHTEPSQEPTIVFVDDDVDATISRLAAQGVTILSEVSPAPYDPRRKIGEIADSEGNRIMISSR